MQTNIELRKQVAELEEAGISLATQLRDLQKDYAILHRDYTKLHVEAKRITDKFG